ncbi:MAG TPA: hypothetical protein VG755_25380 [Nannocystaceae bacterium]|nr:hypothetical protein [Nannocystaceae bacterium]
MFARLRAAAFGVLVLAGCFSESDSVSMSPPPGCSFGAHLCPCQDGACDPGLTCSISADVCVAVDCQVGALECPCGMAGACNPGLECLDGKYCAPPGGNDTNASGSASNSGSASTADDGDATSTSDPSTTAVSTTDPAEGTGATAPSDETMTTDPDTTAASSSEAGSTGPASGCAAIADCGDCVECALADDCATHFAACMEMPIDQACLNGVMSYRYCVAMGDESMCMNCTPGSTDAMAVFDCLADVCSAPCTCL